MQNEYIIKLIGRRPVYRVLPDSANAVPAGNTADAEATAPRPLDGDERRRMRAGLPRLVPAETPA